jgi:hypothetical protein
MRGGGHNRQSKPTGRNARRVAHKLPVRKNSSPGIISHENNGAKVTAGPPIRYEFVPASLDLKQAIRKDPAKATHLDIVDRAIRRFGPDLTQCACGLDFPPTGPVAYFVVYENVPAPRNIYTTGFCPVCLTEHVPDVPIAELRTQHPKVDEICQQILSQSPLTHRPITIDRDLSVRDGSHRMRVS